MEAPEPRAFLALGHEEDPDWALGLERARGPARELRQAGAKRACWEFLPGVAGPITEQFDGFVGQRQ